MGLFSRKRAAGGVSPIYHDLRGRVLTTDPHSVGIAVAEGQPCGALMDMGMGAAIATIVSLGDGTTSMYVSTGGGVIGGGQHEPVRRATLGFLSRVGTDLALFTEAEVEADVAPGMVRVVALMPDGRHVAVSAAMEAVERGGHVLSPLYTYGQEVITQLRLNSPPP